MKASNLATLHCRYYTLQLLQDLILQYRFGKAFMIVVCYKVQ